MAVGVKAQTIGKAIFIELSRNKGMSDQTNQVLIIPDLPNEYGKKAGSTVIFKRSFSPSWSRNSWDYGTRVSTTLGTGTMAELDEQHEEIELDFYGAPRQRNRWSAGSKVITLSNFDELTNEQKVKAHANFVMLHALDSMVSEDNEWSEELVKLTKVGYKVLDETPLIIPIEITDKDMTDLMADSKVPQALVRRLMNARKRPI